MLAERMPPETRASHNPRPSALPPPSLLTLQLSRTHQGRFETILSISTFPTDLQTGFMEI